MYNLKKNSAKIAFLRLKCRNFFGCTKVEPVCFTEKEVFFIFNAFNFRCFYYLLSALKRHKLE